MTLSKPIIGLNIRPIGYSNMCQRETGKPISLITFIHSYRSSFI